MTDLDLASQEGSSDRPSTMLVTKPYDPSPVRESVRGWIAGGLLILLALMALFLMVAEVAGYLTEQTRLERISTALFTPVITLFGAVMGFYFGEHTAARRN